MTPGALAGGFDLEIGSLTSSSWVLIAAHPTSSRSDAKMIEAAANLDGEANLGWSSILILDIVPAVLH